MSGIANSSMVEIEKRAKHIAKRWFTSLGIPFEDQGSYFSVDGKKVPVYTDELVSTNTSVALGAVHKMTSLAGYGTPQLLDRVEIPDMVSTEDEWELVYLRARQLTRTPFANTEEIGQYSRVVRRSAETAFRRHERTLAGMGIDADDLYSVGLVFLSLFLHHYAYRDTEAHNEHLLGAYLKQRFAEFSQGVARKMGESRFVKAHDEDLDLLDLVPADCTPPDAEYTEGRYLVEYYEAGKFQWSEVLEVQIRELDPVVTLDGRILDEDEIEAFGDLVKSGEAMLVSLDELETDDEEVSRSRRRAARKTLETRLSAMSQEDRRHALSMAALSRDVDDEVRREARRICRERVCQSCNQTTTENRCTREKNGDICGGKTISKYGVDPEKFRAEVEAAGSQIAASFVKVSYDQKTSRQLAKFYEENPVRKKTKKEVAPIAEKMAADYMETLPLTMTCPICSVEKPRTDFGVRITYHKYTGDPVRPSKQPRCKKCR